MSIVWTGTVDGAAFRVHQLSLLEDNFSYILETEDFAIIIDPADGNEIIRYVEEKSLKPELCLITHAHTGKFRGSPMIKEKYNMPVFSPRHDKIPIIDNDVEDGDDLSCGKFSFKVFGIPGHGLEHVAYYFEEADLLFNGDTVFILGCGPIEGANEYQYFESLQTIKNLPSKTLKIFADHDHIQRHIEFLKWLDPQSEGLEKFEGDTFVTLEVAMKYNPFLLVATPQELIDLLDKYQKFLDETKS